MDSFWNGFEKRAGVLEDHGEGLAMGLGFAALASPVIGAKLGLTAGVVEAGMESNSIPEGLATVAKGTLAGTALGTASGAGYFGGAIGSDLLANKLLENKTIRKLSKLPKNKSLRELARFSPFLAGIGGAVAAPILLSKAYNKIKSGNTNE